MGGTNPSLLEALGATKLNLLFDIGFNREVAGDTALYWTNEEGDLAALIDEADAMREEKIIELGLNAKQRIIDHYGWRSIADKYKSVFAYQKKVDRCVSG